MLLLVRENLLDYPHDSWVDERNRVCRPVSLFKQCLVNRHLKLQLKMIRIAVEVLALQDAELTTFDSVLIVVKEPASERTHTIPGHGEIVCHSVGFIEPIVMAIYKYLSREFAAADPWIAAAIERNSLPLLYRIFLVLTTLESSTDAQLAEWSAIVKRDRVEPALSQFPYVECGRD
jgi:hypothetical protein